MSNNIYIHTAVTEVLEIQIDPEWLKPFAPEDQSEWTWLEGIFTKF